MSLYQGSELNSLSIGGERILQTLIGADLPDEAWLRSIAAFGELNIRQTSPRRAPGGDGRILGLILFGPADGGG